MYEQSEEPILAEPKAPLPLYRQLASALRTRIAAGQYPVGQKVPTEHELSRSYNVSRATVRNAIQLLSTEGLLKSRAGVGTIVIRAQAPVRSAMLRGLTDDLRVQGVATNARTMSARFITASPAIREKLELPRDERVLHLVRVRDIVGSPFAIINNYIPESVGLDPKDDFSGSLYQLIERKRQLHIIYGEDTIGARLPNDGECELLQISSAAPILWIRRTAFVEFDRPVEYVDCAIRSDLYEYNVTLSR